MAAKIKKGDTVIVLTGKDKGKQGNVLKVFPTKGRCLCKGQIWSSGIPNQPKPMLVELLKKRPAWIYPT